MRGERRAGWGLGADVRSVTDEADGLRGRRRAGVATRRRTGVLPRASSGPPSQAGTGRMRTTRGRRAVERFGRESAREPRGGALLRRRERGPDRRAGESRRFLGRRAVGESRPPVAMAAYKLVLIRHGESAWNLENRFSGWYDADLSPAGHDEAKRGGQALRGEGERPGCVGGHGGALGSPRPARAAARPRPKIRRGRPRAHFHP